MKTPFAENLVRRFVVYTGPSVADPAWLVPVIEISGTGWSAKTIGEYSDVSVLRDLAREMEIKQAVYAAESRVFAQTLETLGLSINDYHEAVMKKKAELAAEQHAHDAMSNEGNPHAD